LSPLLCPPSRFYRLHWSGSTGPFDWRFFWSGSTGSGIDLIDFSRTNGIGFLKEVPQDEDFILGNA